MTKTFHNPGSKIVLSGKTFTVSTRAWSVHLELSEGEPGRFFSPSATQKVCPKCNARFTRKLQTECPRCRVGIEPRIYLVDVTEKKMCDCPSFEMNKREEPGENVLMQCCKHAAAAMILHAYCQRTAKAYAERF